MIKAKVVLREFLVGCVIGLAVVAVIRYGSAGAWVLVIATILALALALRRIGWRR